MPDTFGSLSLLFGDGGIAPDLPVACIAPDLPVACIAPDLPVACIAPDLPVDCIAPEGRRPDFERFGLKADLLAIKEAPFSL